MLRAGTGDAGTITLYNDGTVRVQDIGLFRFVEDTPVIDTPGVEDKYDFFGWGLFSADGQWSTDHPLTTGGVFRGDLDGPSFDAGDEFLSRHTYGIEDLKGKPYHHHRAVAAARVLWNTV